jgi:Flp pilus assembly pilin Flp
MFINWCRRATHHMGRLLRRLARDDGGQDLIEYALLTGIIAIAGILLFPTIQSKMANAYQDWNDNAQAIWETPPPM